MNAVVVAGWGVSRASQAEGRAWAEAQNDRGTVWYVWGEEKRRCG